MTFPCSLLWTVLARRRGNAQVPHLGADFFQRVDTGEARLVLKPLVGFDDTLDAVVAEETLCALAGDFVDGVDEEDAAFARLGLGRASDDDAGFHRRVVEEVGSGNV